MIFEGGGREKNNLLINYTVIKYTPMSIVVLKLYLANDDEVSH